MSDSGFDLDLQNAEEQFDFAAEFDGGIVLGLLDGTTPDEEWLGEIEAGNVLVLSVEGELNEHASGWARDVHDGGGTLMRFRDFLVVVPAGVEIDTDRL
jgi:hypothetical protein